ncbi:ArsI/CadI family heavy metal resistance metalloenzyme [Nocardia sp. NPDC050799]|uniref:ArsI/CadI family heavy metal resistance metalloenzyme n=1 Tax=Nocardia sp. NPDC050799 TaxID=3154842 RepID=UPI0033EF0F24
MSRVQLALNVDDLDQAVEFYSTLFGVQPAKRKPGYANFAVTEPPLKLVLIENPGRGGSVNHLGVEVESSEKVHAEIARLSEAGLFTEEQIATTCCFATQDKVWVTGPSKERWEVYTVLADTEHFGTEPRFAGKDDDAAVQACCGTDGRGEAEAKRSRRWRAARLPPPGRARISE